jgi:hypothetical protein
MSEEMTPVDNSARIAELRKNIRIAELQASIAAAEAPTKADGAARAFSADEERNMDLQGYGMADKFFNEATFGLLPKAGAALQSAAGMSSEGDIFNYDGDFSDRYESNMDIEKERKRRYEEENPIRSGVAGVAGSLYGGGGLMRSGATATRFLDDAAKGVGAGAKRIGAGAIDAAGFGALHAIGNDEDIGTSAGISGAIGAGLSAIPVVGRSIANTATARRLGKALVNKAGEFTPYNIADKTTSYMADFYRNRVGKSFFGKHTLTEQSNAAIAREEAKNAQKVIAQGVKDQGSFSGFIKKLYKEATPKGANPINAFKEGDHTINQLKGRFTDGYRNVWTNSRPASKALLTRLDNIMKTDGLSADALNTFKILKKNIETHVGKPEANRLIDREIKKYSGKFAQQSDNDIVKELTAEVRKNLSKKGAAVVVDLDKRYASYLVLQNASKKAIATNGNFDEKQLMSAISTVGKNNASGSEPLVKTGRGLYNSVQAAKKAEKEALEAHTARIAGKKAASPPTSTGTMEQIANTAMLGSPIGLTGSVALAPLTIPIGLGVAKTASTPTAQRVLAGQMPWQTQGRAALREYDRSKYADALRTGGKALAATVGSNAHSEDEQRERPQRR